MKESQSFFNSSIGKKVTMSLTGLLLFGFLITHLLGNMLLFVSRDAFNIYGFKLTENKAILYFLEAGLIILFSIHIISAIRLTWQNRKARPDRYAVKATLGKSSFASSNTGISGSLVFIFLIIHLKTFKYGDSAYYYLSPYGMVRDLYTTVADTFKNFWAWQGIPFYSVFYIVAIILLGFHLRHGLQSLAKSLGFYHGVYTKWVDRVALALSVFISVGFISMPVYFGFFG